MNIHFYLNNEQETPITSLYDLESNPFAINDIISLDIEQLFPSNYNRYTKSFQQTIIRDNEELCKTFKTKSVKIVREGKSMRFNSINETKLTIEYHCEFVN